MQEATDRDTGHAFSSFSMSRGTEFAHARDPPRAFGGTGGFDHAEQAFAAWANATKPKDAALQALESMRPEIPAIDQHRHSHRHHDPSTLALQRASPGTRANGECEARSKDLFQERFQDRRQRPHPKWIHNAQMISCANRLLRRSERVWQLSGFEVVRGPEPGKGKVGNFDAYHGMAGLFGALRIGIGQRVAEMATGRIRMALDDHDMRQPPLAYGDSGSPGKPRSRPVSRPCDSLHTITDGSENAATARRRLRRSQASRVDRPDNHSRARDWRRRADPRAGKGIKTAGLRDVWPDELRTDRGALPPIAAGNGLSSMPECRSLPPAGLPRLGVGVLECPGAHWPV